MEEKDLNLKLKYKGKYLDTARSQRDFENKFYIGSDKSIFWQILDKAFPTRYNLVSKVGNYFQMHLLDNMDILVKKDDKIMTRNDLQAAKLLKESNLTLDPAAVGRIKFFENWEIEFSFTKHFVLVLSPSEIATAKRYAHLSPLDSQQKFTRIFLLVGVIVTLLGLYIANLSYVPPSSNYLLDRLERIEQIATRVEVSPVEEVEQTPRKRKEVEEKVTEQVEAAQQMTSAEFQSEFGLSLEAGMPGGSGEGDFSGEILEVTEVSEIVATGTGTGSGPNKNVNRGSAELDVTSTGFDLDSAGSGLGDLGGLEVLNLGSTGGFEEVDVANLGGNAGNYNITKVQSKAQFDAVKKRFGGIKMVKEGNIKIEDMTPREKTELANIDQIVNTYKPQISKLFTTESMLMDMYGTIEFSLIINSSGKVEALDIDIAEGSYFTDSFMVKCRQIILNWKIQVKDPIGYSFRMKFLKY
ncbi:MAG: hypothetical protein Q7J16_07850 [Candidatus Cloacimonadales bacterium]|nr:hypothetical protein [Candidatus Cloacimonadales bacterium]